MYDLWNRAGIYSTTVYQELKYYVEGTTLNYYSGLEAPIGATEISLYLDPNSMMDRAMTYCHIFVMRVVLTVGCL